MSDGNLSGDDVKLVRYQIVSIERDRERILENDYELVTDDLTGDAFAAWVIAHHFQGEHRPMTEERKKYLRVCYHVLCRWPRELLRFESRQLDGLEGIERAIRERPREPAAPAGGGGSGAPSGGQPPAAPRPPGSRAGAAAIAADERRVLAALEERGGQATVGQLNADLEGLEWAGVRAGLHALVDRGRVKQTGHGVTARYRLVGGEDRPAGGGGGR